MAQTKAAQKLWECVFDVPQPRLLGRVAAFKKMRRARLSRRSQWQIQFVQTPSRQILVSRSFVGLQDSRVSMIRVAILAVSHGSERKGGHTLRGTVTCSSQWRIEVSDFEFHFKLTPPLDPTQPTNFLSCSHDPSDHLLTSLQVYKYINHLTKEKGSLASQTPLPWKRFLDTPAEQHYRCWKMRTRHR